MALYAIGDLHLCLGQLLPNAEGDIVITYTPTAEPMHDIETAIIVEGCGQARPSERMIKITIKN